MIEHTRGRKAVEGRPLDRPIRNESFRGPASLPDDVWDVFRLDLGDVDDEPEPGDFWLEPDDPEPQ
jgi:hypothetical protein